MYKLAWRNIWRNRRRAVITMGSVFFAAFFCILMTSFNEGTWEVMIDNSLRTQTGHIQIHGRGYWDDRVVDNFMIMDVRQIDAISRIGNVENVSPRLETFAMASFGSVSKGIAVIGISPEKEAQKSNLPSHIVQGEYLSETDDGILIGKGLSKYLNVNIDDTLALIGQGYHGASAAQLFVVRGILSFVMFDMDYGIAYITLPTAQQFIDMPDGYSGILISIKDNNLLYETMNMVSSQLSVESGRFPEVDGKENENNELKTENYDIYSWHFTMERLLKSAESDKAFSLILMYILYLIVGFGILGTVIMMTNERRREFCMMISLGMTRMKLVAVISVELTAMSLMGLILALGVTVPVAHWFAAHPIKISGEMADMFISYGMDPIMPMSVHPSIFTTQIMTVLLIALLAMIYPLNKILRLKINKK